ncbi:MAG: hypothetical protein COT24_05665 [Candidatus Kerfeldbacteria bacterium CG08_land_8_20_14_0_20_40_16]|uniref:Phosphoribosyltransferase domain-containing protein n=1 Tax=Candidatus Kerfeldbacteria bacterium CG08_land_8_20_14_0_20_40_16 TaxID=2014244 RepID=A0A2H0YU43_9BACT|nr:MAG: hypothetical protein COT24_05665 [Candidatus Kerfeldbacteria bacterium CG08_land_8_20_14_0_20_40_16]
MLKKAIQKAIQFFLDILFPINCLGCSKEGKWICEECLQKISLYQKPICPWCEKEQPWLQLCKKCRQESGLDFLEVITTYQNPLLQAFLHNLKYNLAWKMIDDLTPLINNFIKESKQLKKSDKTVFVPIPLYKKRYLARGFNQSELIAKLLSQNLPAIKIEPKLLIRIKNTGSQMKLNKKERLVNIKDAFRCPDKTLVKNKRIILIDDVLTTGSTIKEAALTLRKAGSQSIGALVLAKEELIFKRKNVKVN